MHASFADSNIAAPEDVDAVIWEADPATFQFTYVSRGAERLFGYTLQQWLSAPAFWADMLHADDRDAAVRECRAAVRDCADHTLEYRVHAADGRVLWIRDIVRVICDGHGKATGLQGAMIDITARRRSGAVRQQDAHYYRALIDQALDLIVVFDRHGAIQYESPSTERILGFSAAERVGRAIFELVHPDDVAKLRTVFAGSMATGRPTTLVEFRCRHADGGWRTLEAIGRRFVDESGQPLGIVNCRDITERQRFETRLLEAQKMEALGRVTSAIAHDFNNVLALVIGNVEEALDSWCPAGLRPPLIEIRRAAELGAKLTSQVLAFNRSAPGAPEIVDVDGTLGDLAAILQRLAGSNARVVVELAAWDARVRLARGALEQVAMNLTANARDAMPGGGRIRLSTTATTSHVAIDVTDNGAGMDAAVRQRMFEPYFTTKEDRGTGLGLSTVYRIVQDAAGSIDVDSAPGRGTTIRIYLPRVS